MRQDFKTTLLLLSVAVVLASCGGLLNSDKPADKTFWLSPYSTSHSSGLSADAPDLALSVKVVPGLDSDHLLTMSPDAELNHYEGARWPDHLPEFAGSLLRRSLQESGRFARVSDGRNSGSQDCQLDLEIKRFYTQIDRSGMATSVQIYMSGHFDCQGLSKPVKLAASAAVSGQQLTDIVSAHQRAMDQIFRSVPGQLGKATE